jgi:hypothetical protein
MGSTVDHAAVPGDRRQPSDFIERNVLRHDLTTNIYFPKPLTLTYR